MRDFSEDCILSTNTPFGPWANPVEFFLNPQSEIIRDFRGRHDVCESDSSLKEIFPEVGLRGLSPNFHIHVSVSDLYIPMIGLPILLQEQQEYMYVKRSWEYINRSQTHECGNWDWGHSRNSFSGNL